MKHIYNYELAITDEQRVAMPYGAKLLTVQMQNGRACLWALVNNDQSRADKIIAIYGTGNPLPKHCGQYLATFQSPPFVWHAFDVTEEASV